jgi:membrane protein
MEQIDKIYKRAVGFVTTDVWNLRLDDMPKHVAMLMKYLRITIISVKRYNQDNVELRASSLTYYSLLAIVPILAMGFGIAKGFGFDKDLEQVLIDNFMGQEEALNWILYFINNLLSNTKGGLIAGVALAMLFWSVMKMMGNIEASFNDIWQVKKGRSLVRKFTDYFSVMLIAPVFIFLVGSGQVFIATELDNITARIDIVNLRPMVYFLVRLFPYVMTWALFTLIYIVIPNTKVNFKSAFIAGIIAGSAFLVVQWFYIYLQMGMSRYNVIYGSFAALPLLLMWLRASWVIVLLGAEISFARQNIDLYELGDEATKISKYAHRACDILVMELIIREFIEGRPPPVTQEIANKLKLPIRLVHTLIADLRNSNMILDVVCQRDEKLYAYVPSKDVRSYTISNVIEALDKNGSDIVLKNPNSELTKLLHIQNKITEQIEQGNENIFIYQLADYQNDSENVE